MRILHIDSGREMRGGQWQVWYLLHGLRDRGHEVKLLARPGGALVRRAIAAGFDANPLTVAAIWKGRGWAGVIHAHDARSHLLAVLLGRAVVVSRRVAFPIRTGLLSRWKYRRVDHYIAISGCVAAKLTEAGVESDSISVVYDGVPLLPEIDLSSRSLVVAPATTDPMKGSDLVAQAAGIAGVEVVFSSDLARDLERAALFVYITRSEGLGSAALLAMARGVPVIASRIGGLIEAVEDRESGLLVENTPASISQAMQTLLGDPELRSQLGRAGRERVKRLFTVTAMIEGTLRVYEKVQS